MNGEFKSVKYKENAFELFYLAWVKPVASLNKTTSKANISICLSGN